MERFSFSRLFSGYGPILLALLIGLLVCVWEVSSGYSGLEGTVLNLMFRTRNWLFPWQQDSSRIVFVDINDAALASNIEETFETPLRWPWPRCQWAALHYQLKALGIHPAAIVYDIVFDLADLSKPSEQKGYQISGREQEPAATCDQVFAQAIADTTAVPVFLAALFRPQGSHPYTREQYQQAVGSENARDTYRWNPPPQRFSRFSIPYEPNLHDPVYHAREISIPWDSEWWSATIGLDHFQYEITGLASSLIAHAAGSGMTTMNPEPDGITRWAPLFIEYDQRLYPSLPLQVLLHILGAKPEELLFERNSVHIPTATQTYSIPVDERKRILLNFRHRWPNVERRSFLDKVPIGYTFVNYWRLMDGLDLLLHPQENRKAAFDPHLLDGKIMIIGSSAQATHDLRAIPTEERYPAVGILGTIIRQVLQNDYLRQIPEWVNVLLILGGCLLVGWLGHRLNPISHGLSTILIGLTYCLTSFLLFVNQGWIMDSIHLVLAATLSFAVITIGKYVYVEGIFGRYVTPDVRRYLLSNREALELGGQETLISILFSDLKGFTSMSEKMTASEVITTLNRYFGPMFRIVIDEYQGTLDKLIGDAIMAYFGHPKPTPDHPQRAVSAALKMQKKLAELRQQWEREGLPLLHMRIGINTGTVIAGNIGDAERTDYSIIGDNVNLAQRMEANAPVDGVLISENTYAYVKDDFVIKELDPIHVKNKELPIKVYEVLDFK